MNLVSKCLVATACIAMSGFLGGVVCYQNNPSNPQNACDIVTPPGSPTAPQCITTWWNDPVPKVLSATLGKFWSNPVSARCGYYLGEFDELGNCQSVSSPPTFVGSFVVGQVAVGDGCANPD